MHQISDTTYGHRSGVPASLEEVKGSAEGLEGLPGYLYMIYDIFYILYYISCIIFYMCIFDI